MIEMGRCKEKNEAGPSRLGVIYWVLGTLGIFKNEFLILGVLFPDTLLVFLLLGSGFSSISVLETSACFGDDSAVVETTDCALTTPFDPSAGLEGFDEEARL